MNTNETKLVRVRDVLETNRDIADESMAPDQVR